MLQLFAQKEAQCLNLSLKYVYPQILLVLTQIPIITQIIVATLSFCLRHCPLIYLSKIKCRKDVKLKTQCQEFQT